MEAKLYGTAELSKELGVPVSQIHNWIRAGHIRNSVVNNRTVVEITFLDIKKVRRLAVQYRLVRATEKPYGMRLRGDVIKRTLDSIFGAGQEYVWIDLAEKEFKIRWCAPQNFIKTISDLVDWIIKTQDNQTAEQEKPAHKIYYSWNTESGTTTDCLHGMLAPSRDGGIGYIHVGSSYCRDCEHFGSIDKTAQVVECKFPVEGLVEAKLEKKKEKKVSGLSKDAEMWVREKINQLWGRIKTQEKKQEDDDERAKESRRVFHDVIVELDERIKDYVARADLLFDSINLRCDNIDAMIGKVRKTDPETAAKLEAFEIEIKRLQKIGETPISTGKTEPSSKTIIGEVPYAISVDVNGEHCKTECPYNDNPRKRVMVGSQACLHCIRHRGRDWDHRIVFCSYPEVR